MAATRFGMPLTKGEDFDKARTEQVLAKKLDEAWARVAQKQSDANSVAVFEDRLKTVAKEGDVKLGKIIEFAVLGVISANAFEMEKIECDIARTRDQLLTEITEYQTHLNQLREQKKKLGGLSNCQLCVEENHSFSILFSEFQLTRKPRPKPTPGHYAKALL